MSIRAELHCHNSFSNFHVGENEPPYDCSVSIRDQLEKALRQNLDAIFVTNHNTLSGYDEIVRCKEDHSKFHDIMVYPAEEITTDTGAHILAYGIYDEIPPGLPLDIILDEVRRQNAVSCAPHPFGLLDAIRDDAIQCDMIEVFNSNNVDVISNDRAAEFATTHSMIKMAGSDSHVLSAIGRCANTIESSNDLDSILNAMRHGQISVEKTGYVSRSETLEHLEYKIRNSRQYLEDYITEHYSNSRWLLRLLLHTYSSNPDSILWTPVYKLGVYLMGRVSSKVNQKGADPSFMKGRNLGSMLRMSI
ncbi:MAG: PHP domain-containing protein [Cenarchaeum sp. SB0661_bin_35]|nr:PHP domain-containing protein [Cenarchaeum sp. SB0667_bin_13]MXZ93729.1 PHP domain-containing protein [Cenarchaeum sp. SB0666_bin_15]MYC79154.1 PHP domain-containing protein [Cenarchaeum sp. SB0661_bin_35]MYI51988.1 PHP domain-containing protein [Cenarchaeum sp. SB0673_bin_9]